MNNNDNGMSELLELLKAHPELVREIVFDSGKLSSLLESEEARELVHGVDFLKYMAASRDGYPIAFCGECTEYFCAKGTEQKLMAACQGSTGGNIK